MSKDGYVQWYVTLYRPQLSRFSTQHLGLTILLPCWQLLVGTLLQALDLCTVPPCLH